MDGDKVRWEVRVGGYENGRAPSSREAHRLARELRKRFGVGKVTVWRIRRVTWTRVTDDPATWPEKGREVLVTDDCGKVTMSFVTARGWCLWSTVVAWRPMPPPARVKR